MKPTWWFGIALVALAVLLFFTSSREGFSLENGQSSEKVLLDQTESTMSKLPSDFFDNVVREFNSDSPPGVRKLQEPSSDPEERRMKLTQFVFFTLNEFKSYLIQHNTPGQADVIVNDSDIDGFIHSSNDPVYIYAPKSIRTVLATLITPASAPLTPALEQATTAQSASPAMPLPPSTPPPTVQNCPLEFEYAPGGTECIMSCPGDKGYETTGSLGSSGYSCTYTKDKTIAFKLKSTPRYQSTEGPTSYMNLPNASVYKSAIDDFYSNLAVTQGRINREEQIASAFQKLQDAENVRDQSPDAYETARIAYYTLTKGESWINDEKQRVANTEAQPVVNNFLSSYEDLVKRTDQQQQTIDAVDGVKDNLISVTDDMRFSVSAFDKQISEIKNQIEIDKKKKAVEKSNVTSWFDFILNMLIIIITCVAIFFVGRAVMKRVKPSVPITPPKT